MVPHAAAKKRVGMPVSTDYLDHSQVWRDRHGRRWRWSDHEGWIVDGLPRFHGVWPEERLQPFTKDES